MPNVLVQYAKTAIELHRKLNDQKYKGDIGSEYKAFHAQYASLKATSDELLCSYMTLSLHDCCVQKLTSNKNSNGYFIQFIVSANRYIDQREAGKVYTQFTICSSQKLREINGRELYDVVFDDTTNEILFMFWSNNRLQNVIVPYSFLRIEYATP